MAGGRKKRGARREPEVAAADSDAAPRSPPKPPGKRKRSGKKGGSGVGRFFYWSLVVALWMVIAGIGGVVWIGAHLPPIQALEIPKRPPSIRLVGIDGHVLTTRGDGGGEALPLKELPPYLPKAFIAIEDRRFYEHHGVDPFGIARAVLANILRRGLSQGGSTITQQLAKNLFLTQERTLARKIQELALAFWLERKFSKREILELYL